MAQMTLSERDVYRQAFDLEYHTTRRVLRAYPPDQADLRPHARSRSARELAWGLVLSQRVVDAIVKGVLDPSAAPDEPPPTAWAEIVRALEEAHREATRQIDRLSEDDLGGMVRMPVGPRRMGEERRGNALWMMLNDSIHHRGQLTVYLRMAGGRVPSIYGPSADEPWS
jgi:uncharacterized damage-inducible protein DinB